MKIKTYNKISKKGLSLFPLTYEISDATSGEDAIVVRSASLLDMEFDENLKAIARAGAGVNNIPLDVCSQKGIVVFNTPGANANAVKELVIAAMIMSARPIFPAMEWVQTLGESNDLTKAIEKGKSNFVGPELVGKRIGVIGLGAIGIKVANFALHLGMEVYGYDPFISVESAWSLSKHVNHARKIEEIYKKCDFITLHLPENTTTKKMLNEESLKLMKNGTRILNFARGGLVDSKAMINAVEKGKVASYITDFPTVEMLGRKNIYAIPHLGASTPESEENCAMMAVKQLVDFLDNGNIANSVNLPTTVMERGEGVRFVFIHRNVPNMIAQITNVFSKASMNIDNLINKSKNEMAVTLVDTLCLEVDMILDELKNIDQMLSVRVIRGRDV